MLYVKKSGQTAIKFTKILNSNKVRVFQIKLIKNIVCILDSRGIVVPRKHLYIHIINE